MIPSDFDWWVRFALYSSVSAKSKDVSELQIGVKVNFVSFNSIIYFFVIDVTTGNDL